MAISLQEEYLTGIANAIREKEGSSAVIPANTFETRIRNLSTILPTQEKIISPSTSQIIVTPDSGKTLSKVTVNAISPVKLAATYTPTTTDQVIPASRWLSGAQTIKGDANLIASNIKSGVSIFNVTGIASGAKTKKVTGATDASSILSFNVGESISKISSIWSAVPTASWSSISDAFLVFAVYFDNTVNWSAATKTGMTFFFQKNSSNSYAALYYSVANWRSSFDPSGNVTLYRRNVSPNLAASASWDVYVTYE